jgi:ribose 5-phosphate isomerase B
MNNLKISIACDHAGFKLKEQLVKYLLSEEYKVDDLGTYTDESVDYPDFGHLLAVAVEAGNCDYGISICGSGNGINMVVNKHPGIRSALCWNEEISRLARAHNDANVCALPGRFINYETAVMIINIFLNTNFEGGRHKRRVNKIPLL